jgi:hypothetical protein
MTYDLYILTLGQIASPLIEDMKLLICSFFYTNGNANKDKLLRLMMRCKDLKASVT